MARKKADDAPEEAAPVEDVAGPWKPLTACFSRLDELAAAAATGIDPDKARFVYSFETRNDVEGVALTVEEA